jgi:imidazolonepropionase-like amidohydrolase
MSGPKNPYPGKLGVIEEGAFADLLLVNGNPLEDISILTKPDESLALIMKRRQDLQEHALTMFASGH